jgi:predicted DNA-binding transcriptional regulator AlpA
MSTPQPEPPAQTPAPPSLREIVARVAAATRWGDEDTASRARQELRVRRLERAVAEVVAAFPPLSADQKQRLHALLEPGRSAVAADARHAGLNVKQLSEYLTIPIQTLYYWRRTGTGPRSYKVGRELRYGAEDVQEWLEGQRRAG